MFRNTLMHTYILWDNVSFLFFNEDISVWETGASWQMTLPNGCHVTLLLLKINLLRTCVCHWSNMISDMWYWTSIVLFWFKVIAFLWVTLLNSLKKKLLKECKSLPICFLEFYFLFCLCLCRQSSVLFLT